MVDMPENQTKPVKLKFTQICKSSLLAISLLEVS